jgi:protein-S-isoprenylcysteine O-methyltransferase Ste14
MLTQVQPYITHLILIVCWLMFAVVHHLMATDKCKNYGRRLLKMRFRYYRLIYCGIAFVTLGAVLFVEFSIRSASIPIPKYLAVAIAIPTGIGGLILMLNCVFKYFRRFSGVAAFRRDDTELKLETSGVNKYVRHPLYLGTLLFIWALFLLHPLISHLAGCMAVTGYVWIGIISEEKKLVNTFGEAYTRYQQNTPRLIPRLTRN